MVNYRFDTARSEESSFGAILFEIPSRQTEDGICNHLINKILARASSM